MNLIGDSSDPNVPAVAAIHSANGRGVNASSATGIAIAATATSDTAVFAHSDSGRGVDARSNKGIAIAATATSDTAVFAQSDSGRGVDARSNSNEGVHAETSSNTSAAIAGISTGQGGQGVHGEAQGPIDRAANPPIGVVGKADSGSGVAATNSNALFPVILGRSDTPGAAGVVGYARASSGPGVGVRGKVDSDETNPNNPVPLGVWGECKSGLGLAGYFNGNVQTSGDLTVTGTFTASTKLFKIDHPLDPANKYLVHASVESYEMIDIYTGNVTTDAAGSAAVRLPNYIQAMHNDFRYQLTVVGQFAKAIVSEEVVNNQFAIKTDKPNVKVSWQVAGVRQDSFAKANPLVTEEEKAPETRGLFLHPKLFGQPEEKGLVIRTPSTALNFDIK